MFIAFKFLTDKEARAVYDTIRSCTCKLGTLEKLLAFTYEGVPREKKIKGWDLYDPRREFARQGISPKSAEKGWRFTEINKDYSVSLFCSFEFGKGCRVHAKCDTSNSIEHKLMKYVSLNMHSTHQHTLM
jgi:hypothetical protein